MKITGFTEPEPSGWDSLYQGAEREAFDSPSRFELSSISTVMPRRPPAPPEPVSTAPSPIRQSSPRPAATGGGAHSGSAPASVYLPSSGSRVRPYTRTGGRTRTAHDLALEALVSTSDDGRRYRGVRTPEHRQICDICLDTRSIAEIAAHLRLPLGVVKVLVGDMADAGLVLIHQTELILGDSSSRAFMERVLQGLRTL
ncbi:DUF742 domain-containing protein [Amycolatopsis regifaucium]|uniref:Multi-component regulatory system-8 n=1 Tax=Amycolatopsis regifaucium TaxID=546365 RepID=A0A154MSK0_9PSEU|nr:DUF742 domain-containing protein [Amycolatopsis regifaucium]KZB87241.1 multi-component regulatory system-8 [Amycolatopsis regifaucium]OKA08072.1 multi-component regulatory system-8 [Amycolatopsis regifaucium]SFI38624.1 Protein of unknown function [Amycolatopsis regifaucium]